MNIRICPHCGREFEARYNQVFCSKECLWRGRMDLQDGEPSFTCAQCGRPVVILDERDKRTRFCCRECEKRYWRHPPHENTTQNINFKSISALKSWEKRTSV